jgi:hypothetical protein
MNMLFRDGLSLAGWKVIRKGKTIFPDHGSIPMDADSFSIGNADELERSVGKQWTLDPSAP